VKQCAWRPKKARLAPACQWCDLAYTMRLNERLQRLRSFSVVAFARAFHEQSPQSFAAKFPG
jgi:hypothetical protein